MSSTETPRAAQLLEQQAHGAPPDRVERRRRLVEQQQPRLADERLRDPEPLLHPLRHAVDAALRGLRERDELEQARALGGAAARAGEPLVQLEHLVGRVPAGEAEELGEVAERARARRASLRARPATSAAPPVGRTRPTAIFTSVDLPAPFGPSSPTSSPSPTSRSTPFSASTEP